MKFLRVIFRVLLGLALLLVLACVALYLTGNGHLIKAVRSTYLVGKGGPTIDDYAKFSNRVVEVGSPQPWKKDNNYNSYLLSNTEKEALKIMETTSFFVLHDKKVVFEKYWDDYNEKSLTNSFSMAKSLTSLCIGKAIDEGKIKSVHQKVSDFIPEFNTPQKANITLKDLLTMSSGIDFGESYGDPFGFMAKTYYGENLYQLTIEKPTKYQPGEVWHYQGGNTLLLSFILKKATGVSVSDYFSAKFWKPLGAKQAALWTTNKEEGKEKAYCCFYSNASDFARIGQLMLDSGRWQEQQLISEQYFKESISPIHITDVAGQNIDYYGYQWWLGSYNNVSFHYARGIQGQYIVSIPDWNVAFVRLGHKRDPTRGVKVPSDLFTYLAIVEKIIQ